MGKKIPAYILIAFLTFVSGIGAVPTEYVLSMLGYSSKDIRDIVSGKKTLLQIDMDQKQKMAGLPAFRYITNYPDKKHPLIEPALPYFTIINDACLKNRIKNSLILAVIKVESNFNKGAVSPKGAMGLMQLMPDTAQDLGVKNPFDPIQNIDGGVRYLSYCLQTFNNLPQGLAAYNAGPAKISKLNRAELNETKEYIEKVLYFEKMYAQLTK